MIGLASERLREFGDRVDLRQSQGGTLIEDADGRYDRFVSNYVVDLLSAEAGAAVVSEAHRLLCPGGLLCMVSLTHGRNFATRIVSGLWTAVYRINAGLVGGCRPIELRDLISAPGWVIGFNTTVAAVGITSEVLVAKRR